MDRLQTMEVFVAVAEAGGFAKAAARLRLSPPAVTRAVVALEERLGVRLLNRTTRSVVPTEAGLRFLESARQLLAQLELAEREAAGEMAEPSGTLTVSASVTFARHAVSPVIREYLHAHPRVAVSLMASDRLVQLVEEGVDVAVRIGELPDSALVARQVGTVRRMLVASPGYLARAGRPQAPADLAGHALIDFNGALPGRDQRGVPARASARYHVNDAASAIQAAEEGEGITLALSYAVAASLRDGRLEEVLPAHAPPPVPVRLVYPPARLVAPKLRAFLALASVRLAERLSGDLAVGSFQPAQE
ncbi:MAG: LysR family transcriptional regulator [Acetobacteraceae bacterium]|nr:LysR family transcriptional regulator [Acetobacteraceae bacterium]